MIINLTLRMNERGREAFGPLSSIMEMAHPSPLPRSGKWAKLTFRVGNKLTIAICRADYLCPRGEKSRLQERTTMLFVVGPVMPKSQNNGRDRSSENESYLSSGQLRFSTSFPLSSDQRPTFRPSFVHKLIEGRIGKGRNGKDLSRSLFFERGPRMNG